MDSSFTCVQLSRVPSLVIRQRSWQRLSIFPFPIIPLVLEFHQLAQVEVLLPALEVAPLAIQVQLQLLLLLVTLLLAFILVRLLQEFQVRLVHILLIVHFHLLGKITIRVPQFRQHSQ